MAGSGRGTPELSPEEVWRAASQAKRTIRASMGAVRRALPLEARAERARSLIERVMALEAWAQARVVATYRAMRAELNIDPLADRAQGQGKRMCYPGVDPGSPDLWLRSATDAQAFDKTPMGFMQPTQSSPLVDPAEIDLILVPALALDVAGTRLGWGKGYYDRLLPSLPRALRVGVAYDFQLLGELPRMPTDAPMHIVVTDERTVEINPPCAETR